ncbi:FAD-binding protein [Parvibaculum sedimenti]|uniref:FAD-binding protein n=1 Tax=Parvibaculum sedimenti TaxID=2608632 RepID=A0A6N6VF72_9HYPH|nr:FAD-binding oxidoreductase [Parvibaculum sedimenti]KAB7738839.1 FAD-binding protein [Parvibaculum sedimenti]
MTIDRTTLRWNGWGPVAQENALPDGAPQWDWIRTTLGMPHLPNTPAKPLSDINMPACRVGDLVLAKLRAIVGEAQVKLDDYERAFHARGKSYHDLLYLRAGKLDMVPDAVIYPRNPDEALAVVRLAAEEDITLIPYGGGSSVVGGVNAMAKSLGSPVLTLDTTLMTRLIQIDKIAMTATVEAGIYGPALEEQLQKHGVTLAHYPQSFQFSTVGGWIAARGAGQQSNRYGKAEKWLVSARLATPKGFWTTEATPASAAGPNLNQLIAGSEGTIGVICEATVKIHEVPARKDYRGYLFKNFASGVEAARRINHADIPVAMVRLSDAQETHFFQAFSSTHSETGLKARLQRAYLRHKGFDAEPCLMLVGHEGDAETVIWAQERTEAICAKLGALKLGTGPGQKWYHSRFNSPYARDPMLDHGIGLDTLETATRWSNIGKLHKAVVEAIDGAMKANMPEVTGRGIVMAHLSHSYPDGASLYFTFVFPRQLDREVEQWQAIKRAASDAIIENRGTISHHHGVGTDHAPWLAEEKGPIGYNVLKSLKRELDPTGVLNPGKLLG